MSKTQSYLFSSESVSEGHPDKMADQISDAVLDSVLSQDPAAKVACETLITRGHVIAAGEMHTSANPSLPLPDIIRSTIKDIGYIDPTFGFDYRDCDIQVLIGEQSKEINLAVEHADGEIGAGDQGLMFGYAVDETPELMPLPISLAHRLVQKQAEVRKSGHLPWLRPDAKSQVTVRYAEGRPQAVTQVVLSTQHAPAVSNREITEAVRCKIIDPVIPESLRDNGISYHVNPSGRFETGGPAADTGLTGRKIIVDTYGGSCPHGGGAFSGKDPTKVDRSASYVARWIAKNIVAAGLSRRCTIQLSYAIGIADPLSLMIDLHGEGIVETGDLVSAVREIFDLTPAGIIAALDLRRPIYRQTAAYGHFGRELSDFTWERTDRAADLRQYFGLDGENHPPASPDSNKGGQQ